MRKKLTVNWCCLGPCPQHLAPLLVHIPWAMCEPHFLSWLSLSVVERADSFPQNSGSTHRGLWCPPPRPRWGPSDLLGTFSGQGGREGRKLSGSSTGATHLSLRSRVQGPSGSPITHWWCQEMTLCTPSAPRAHGFRFLEKENVLQHS